MHLLRTVQRLQHNKRDYKRAHCRETHVELNVVSTSRNKYLYRSAKRVTVNLMPKSTII